MLGLRMVRLCVEAAEEWTMDKILEQLEKAGFGKNLRCVPWEEALRTSFACLDGTAKADSGDGENTGARATAQAQHERPVEHHRRAA